ncbi:MAG: ABC transporter ATP-binding protein [Proteobacteria bacterium]|nr:ABC transporter ATP-binding protein [Pseudomonadota bacterium]
MYYRKSAKPVELTQLKLEDVSLSFGGVQALSNISIDLSERMVMGIIGPNGAGKTSIMNCISGFYRPQKGRIVFGGHDLIRTPSHKIAQYGIARTFQNIALYTGMSVQDNIMAGRHVLMKRNFLSGGLYFGRARTEEIEHRLAVEEIIDFLEITAIRKSITGMLPYGLRKRVELARALALEPKVLLLDETMAGMNANEKEDMARFIIDIFELRGIPIILVEHDMGVVMDICDKLCVLDFGEKIAEGTPEEIKRDPKVVAAYLGAKRGG